ncbi:hypothetical protein SNOG_06612 [Parastagonospora nodorum SN15]|uniref:Uncharacterized protein n=1 Tax=Phaeosphaeria nodorum (strain SN15 / ATCC MYA-4574 / FGSC 10173) TaxID=321614 RepID=Q0UNQ2_PHANO|nr:hypothetical protein SNOG_06612 [Parastagonospora nodorum SN15]EAT86443.1 hypothetical protein SNOG_06612 [Parastagonospora nodorum SN15]
MAEAIVFALSSQATDPRDRVYGVLGLVELPTWGEALRLDYDLSACPVYQQATSCISLQYALPSPSRPKTGTPPKKSPRDYHVPKRCDRKKCGSLREMNFAAGMATR